jgi:hypothetical protein
LLKKKSKSKSKLSLKKSARLVGTVCTKFHVLLTSKIRQSQAPTALPIVKMFQVCDILETVEQYGSYGSFREVINLLPFPEIEPEFLR